MNFPEEENTNTYISSLSSDLSSLCQMGGIDRRLNYDLLREVSTALELRDSTCMVTGPLPQHYVECAVRLNGLLMVLESCGKTEDEVALICSASSSIYQLIENLGELCFSRYCCYPESWEISDFARLK